MLLIATDSGVVTNLIYHADLPLGCVASRAIVDFLIGNGVKYIE